MSIFGIGSDLCDVTRIAAALDRHGERFVRRILADDELALYNARIARAPERGPRFVATRFAAKEAFSKAVGLGMRLPMTWRRCEVSKAPSGAPSIRLHGDLAAWFDAQGLKAHVTLSDEGDMALAVVVVERISPI